MRACFCLVAAMLLVAAAEGGKGAPDRDRRLMQNLMAMLRRDDIGLAIDLHEHGTARHAAAPEDLLSDNLLSDDDISTDDSSKPLMAEDDLMDMITDMGMTVMMANMSTVEIMSMAGLNMATIMADTTENEVLDQAYCKPMDKSVNLQLPINNAFRYLPTCVVLPQCGSCDCNFGLRCQPKTVKQRTLKVFLLARRSSDLRIRRSHMKSVKPYITVNVTEHTSCGCLCVKTEHDCDVTKQQYDKNTCSCKCIDRTSKKACEAMSNTRYWNNADCSCRCRKRENCTSPLYFSRATCSCRYPNKNNNNLFPENNVKIGIFKKSIAFNSDNYDDFDDTETDYDENIDYDGDNDDTIIEYDEYIDYYGDNDDTIIEYDENIDYDGDNDDTIIKYDEQIDFVDGPIDYSVGDAFDGYIDYNSLSDNFESPLTYDDDLIYKNQV